MKKIFGDSEDLEESKPAKSSYKVVKNCSYKKLQFRVGKPFDPNSIPKEVLKNLLDEGLVEKG